MTAQGPVCHIPPETTVTTQPGPVALPSVPPAQPNVQSLTATVNALRQLVMYLAGQLSSQGSQSNNRNSQPARWTEASRTVAKVKIYQDNDPNSGNFVEVEQLNKLVMRDGVTGESWTWNR